MLLYIPVHLQTRIAVEFTKNAFVLYIFYYYCSGAFLTAPSPGTLPHTPRNEDAPPSDVGTRTKFYQQIATAETNRGQLPSGWGVIFIDDSLVDTCTAG